MLEIIEQYLTRIIREGSNATPIPVETEMVDPNNPSEDDWNNWLSIESSVSNADISALETEFKIKYPKSYIDFLKYKHFYSLNIHDCHFFSHPIRKWKDELRYHMKESLPIKTPLFEPLIPFADWDDWGVLCFDTRNKDISTEYPIVLWDHEKEDEVEPVYNNFESMIKILDEQSED